MPFWYHIPVPVIPECSGVEFRLTKWLVEEGRGFHAGTPLAIIECQLGRFAVLANGYGLVGAKLVTSGSSVQMRMPIATAITDGEAIPY
ncbi:MAG TPA: hypothetical protein VGS41_00630, partial [Chthonomonadales bacterium]|nr:hypothetical protein [Chthonomonadales bacterium]